MSQPIGSGTKILRIFFRLRALQGSSAGGLGDLDRAREHRRYLRAGSEGNPEIVLDEAAGNVLHKQLDALFAWAEGNNTDAVALAREAVSLERALPFRYGPPRIVKPTAEMLGDILLKLDRAEEAVAAYQDQLSRTPHRTVALLGLARAAKAAGDSAEASNAYRQLTQIWHAANHDVPGYAEAIEGAKKR